MGFLNWFQDNSSESDSQLNLLGDSQPITPHERVDGTTVYKDFSNAIKDSGGSSKAHGRAVKAETQELFDCGVDELYEATGGRKGDRASLPKEAQKAYMVSETVSTHRLNHDLKGENHGSQKQKDDHVVETVRDTAENVRKWLPW